MWSKEFVGLKNFYFIGIGGVSMSGLAKLLHHTGYTVSGRDDADGETVKELVALGVSVTVGKGEISKNENLKNAHAVVYTNAVPETDEELLYAKKADKKIYRRAELLKVISEGFSFVTAIGGSHGKTTCTSMCAHVLKAAGVPFAAHIGGMDSVFGNFYLTGFDHFVTETCEYKKNVLEMFADRAILLNIDLDHMECYDGESDLVNTFRTFCLQAKAAFVCADDERCAAFKDFVTFGIKNKYADYRATELRKSGERYSFTVTEYGKELCRVKLKAIGRYNIYNALAALAAMRSYGFDEKEIVAGLEDFVAVKRRFEVIGGYRGATFICDYAHHPKEISSVVKTARATTKGRLFVVFQPHTYSRTKLLMNEFLAVLKPLRDLIVYKTYPAREFYDEEGSARTLARKAGNCLYIENSSTLKTYLKRTVKEGDCVLFLGAGDIYYAAKFLLNELNR